MIRIIDNTNIDKNAYNRCVQGSREECVYAISWYLDAVSPRWKAIVYGDYAVVMPLPVKKRYCISYISQPPYSQKLGLFSAEPIEASVLEQFFALLMKYPVVQYTFWNEVHLPHVKSYFRKNYILSLQSSYKDVSQNYSSHCKRNIAKAQKNCLGYHKLDMNRFVDFYNQNSVHDSKQARLRIPGLLQSAEANKSLMIFAASLNNKLSATVACITWNNRIYFVMPCSSLEGKNVHAMFGIVDSIIQEYAGTHYVLDFEGSEIPGVARFYEGFGASVETYGCVKKFFLLQN